MSPPATAPARQRTSRGRRPGAPDTRAEVLAAARASFAEKGFRGTTIRAVAASAGVATPPAVNIGTGSAPASATSLTSAYGAWSSFAAR